MGKIKITNGSPVIEGEQATFYWYGQNPPRLMGDFTDWEQGEPLNLINMGEDIWTISIKFPLDAYLEYILVRGKTRVLDPLNPNLTPNGLGRYNNFFSMPEYKRTTLADRIPGVPRGRVTRHSIPTWNLVGGGRRRVHLYQPPTPEPSPLVVVLDGQDYLRRARLPIIVDNLIAQKRIQPVSMAFVENHKKIRVIEYSCSESVLFFLVEVVIPMAAKKLNILDISESPGGYGIIGASMGGLMALYAGLRMPEIFGSVLTQSGGFSMGGHEMAVFGLARNAEKKPSRIWMDVGVYDFVSLLEANRQMNAVFNEQGYNFGYREYHAGHNYPAWRDEIWRGLEDLFSV